MLGHFDLNVESHGSHFNQLQADGASGLGWRSRDHDGNIVAYVLDHPDGHPEWSARPIRLTMPFLSVETGFDGFARRYTRDAAGRVTKVTKASRRTSELRYDALGRITDVAHSDGTFERYRYGRDGSLLEASNDNAPRGAEPSEVLGHLTAPNGTGGGSGVIRARV